jgi:prepilin-type processing-associated H-X9-DG protein
MKISLSANPRSALTLIEVLMVIVAVMIITAVVLPSLSLAPRGHGNSLRIRCVNNQKQIGLAYRVWEGDNGDKFPMAISETNGGTMEFITGTNAWRHFQVMSNELSTPKVLVCPTESHQERLFATNFTFFNNSNLSFFVGVDATNDETNPAMILSGDHNITNGMSVKNGLLELTTNQLAGWTAEMHNKVGNILLADGSVQQVSISGLREAVANTGIFTNRLQMPILGP